MKGITQCTSWGLKRKKVYLYVPYSDLEHFDEELELSVAGKSVPHALVGMWEYPERVNKLALVGQADMHELVVG